MGLKSVEIGWSLAVFKFDIHHLHVNCMLFYLCFMEQNVWRAMDSVDQLQLLHEAIKLWVILDRIEKRVDIPEVCWWTLRQNVSFASWQWQND